MRTSASVRTRVLISLALMLACASNTAAAPDLLVGVTEDGLKTEPEAAINDARKLGLGAIRITLRWRPGLTTDRRTARRVEAGDLAIRRRLDRPVGHW